MGLSICNTVTDLHDQELSRHGDMAFPIACYADDLSQEKIPWQKEVLRSFQIVWEAIAEEQELAKVNRIRSMMEFVEFHYMEDLTVEQIAKSVSISNSACLRCFHEMLNTTPMQYVMEIRLKKAAALLRSTNKPAKDIALDCGFNDVSYFIKMFRLKYNSTPGKYRKLS